MYLFLEGMLQFYPSKIHIFANKNGRKLQYNQDHGWFLTLQEKSPYFFSIKIACRWIFRHVHCQIELQYNRAFTHHVVVNRSWTLIFSDFSWLKGYFKQIAAENWHEKKSELIELSLPISYWWTSFCLIRGPGECKFPRRYTSWSKRWVYLI